MLGELTAYGSSLQPCEAAELTARIPRMLRRRRAALLAVLLAAALGAGCRRAAAGPRRPNVLLVTIDTIRADHVGAYGGAQGATPAIDAFARDAVLFEQAIAAAPLTLPSHVAILSGILPFRSGVRVNGTDHVGPNVPLVAEAFAEKGYRTGAFVSALVVKAGSGLARGFARYDDSFESNRGKDERVFAVERPGEETTVKALEWIAQQRAAGAPFFAWVHLYDPHAPYAPPPSFAARFPSSPYDGEIAYADSCFARLLAGVDAANTAVLLAGDHGESLGEHGEEGHGVFVYDATVRVPLLLRLPGRRLAGTRIRTQVRLADVAPTLRGLAGLAAAESDGEDLAPLLTPSPGAAAADRPAFSEADYATFVLGWSPMRALRAGGRKYIEAPRRELYDLRADPGERENAYARDGEAARELARQLAVIAAKKPLAAATSSAVDPEAARRLASLGYISGAGQPVDYDRIDATRTDPKDRIGAWTQIEAGLLARQTRDYEKAVGIFERLLAAYPTLNPVILRDYAEACRETGRLDRAIELYERVLKTAEPDANDFFGLGVAWHLKGDRAKSAENLDRAVAMNPSDKTAWVDLGSVRLSLRDLPRAGEAFAKAAALDPKSSKALSGLASIAFEQRDYGKSEGLLRSAIAAAPEDAQLRFNLARVKRAMGDLSAARAIYVELTKSSRPEVAQAARRALDTLR
jgi:arylsulfatase A-like enzyme/thioredoxin-like negative regulator of GroEL